MIKPYINKKIMNILCMGLSTGIPFLLTLTTLNIWLKECGISNTTIGLFVITTLPATFRFMFGPIIDSYSIPFLNKFLCQRRVWIFFSQFMCVMMLIGISFSDPSKNILETGTWAFCISFFSSLKDVAIQAYRIEIIEKEKEGYASTASNLGFRIGMIMGGGGALFVASFFSWKETYQIFAGIIFILLIQTLFCQSSHFIKNNEKFINKYKNSILDILKNKNIMFIFLFVLFYKMNDILLSCMMAPFLNETGYSKLEMAETYNLVGILSMIGGGIIGGNIIVKNGIKKSIIYGSLIKSFSAFIFFMHALLGKNIYLLLFSVGFDKFIGMLTTSVLISYFSSYCKFPYISTQFSLWSSYGSICRIGITIIGGYIADQINWPAYFLFTSLSCIPCFFILKKSIPKEG